jgi:hypothetical protein
MKYVFGRYQRPQEQSSIWPDIAAAVCLVVLLLAFIAIATMGMAGGV